MHNNDNDSNQYDISGDEFTEQKTNRNEIVTQDKGKKTSKNQSQRTYKKTRHRADEEQEAKEKILRTAENLKEKVDRGVITAEEKLVEAKETAEEKLVEARQVIKEKAEIDLMSSQKDNESHVSSEGKKYQQSFDKARLYDKTVFLKDHPIGSVVKESNNSVIISDTDNTIFDVPKSFIIFNANGDPLIDNTKVRDISMFRVQKSNQYFHDKEEQQYGSIAMTDQNNLERPDTQDSPIKSFTAGAIESDLHSRNPPTEVGSIKTVKHEPIVEAETEVVKKLKSAALELKDIIISVTATARQKIKQARETAEEKKAESEAYQISKMGELASHFANSFEEVLSEIRTRTFAEQEQIYNGFLTLMDKQRELIAARRDLAARLKNSVANPVVGPDDMRKIPKARELTEVDKQQSTPTGSQDQKISVRMPDPIEEEENTGLVAGTESSKDDEDKRIKGKKENKE